VFFKHSSAPVYIYVFIIGAIVDEKKIPCNTIAMSRLKAAVTASRAPQKRQDETYLR